MTFFGESSIRSEMRRKYIRILTFFTKTKKCWVTPLKSKIITRSFGGAEWERFRIKYGDDFFFATVDDDFFFSLVFEAVFVLEVFLLSSIASSASLIASSSRFELKVKGLD